MKKQINPTIKAHLIRSAFYVILLLAVCVIPFALAQRNTTKQRVAKPRSAAKLAASGKQSGVPGSLTGVARAPQRKAGAVQRELPFDLRPLPANAAKYPYSSIRDPNTPINKSTGAPTGAQKRVSSVPTTTGPTGVGKLRFLRQPRAPQVVLYDQYDNSSGIATFSGTLTDFPDFNADLADDFVVPGGETWNVESVDADGVYFNGVGPADNFNVFFYTDSGGLPGTQVYSALAQSYSQVGTTFTVNLSVPAVLSSGTYWVEVQGNTTFGTQGQWGWSDRTVLSNNPAAWQNPGGGFGICPGWTVKTVCIPTAGGPDQVYRLNGTTGGGACTNYTFTSGADPIVPGDTDIGNHTDDGDTFVALPFSFQLYDQTFTGVNVSSNGRLDFVCINEPGGFASACIPPPDNICAFDYTVFPDWTDLRTDIVGEGCANFASGCGVFTSVTGSAPNRIFNIEWRAVYFNDHTQTANFEARLYESDPSHRFDFVFGDIQPGSDQLYVSGVEQNASTFTEDFCDAAPPAAGSRTYTCGGGPTPSPTPSPTCTPGAGGLLIGSGMTTGYLPNGWEPTLASNTINYTFNNSQSAPNEFALFDTHDAWGFTVIKDAITSNGHTYTEFTPAQLSGFNFADYRVIILNWDDTSSGDFLADYSAAIPALEAYINAGGVVWVAAAIQSCDSIPMPFGGQGNGCDFGDNDPIVDPANPMMVGMPDPIPGNSASHLSFSGLPGLAHVVVNSNTSGQPALYELFPGGGGCTPTPSPSPTATPSCTPVIVNGSIDLGDPTQTDRMFRDGIPSTCEAPKICPGPFGDGQQHHYDSYTYTNNTGSTQCVTVNPTTECVGTNYTFVVAYLGSFNPADICQNYLADSGSSPDPAQPPVTFSFNVDPGQSFVVVVSEVTADAGCPSYTLTIDGLCGGGTPSPTPTATPTCPPGGAPVGAPGPWTAGNPYPTTIVRYGFVETATHFYVFGGVDNGTAVNSVNRMDLATGTWESRAPMPFGGEAPTCALDESTGIVYCADGITSNSFAAYDIAADSWTPLAPDNLTTDHYGSASGVFNGKVFVAGGFTNGAAVDVYDIASNTWSAGTAAPLTFFLAGYHQIGQFLYVVGGFDPAVINNATTWRLDMSSAPGVWENGPAFTPQRADFGLAYDPGTNKLYALGGDLPNDGNFFNSTNLVDELDLSGWPGGTWNPSPPDLPLPNRQANQAGFYGNGEIWSVGGLDGFTFQFLNEVWHRNNGGGVVCPSPTATPTPPVSPTPTPTATATITPPPSPTATATATATATITPPPPSPTLTPTPTRPPPTPRPRPTPYPRPTP